MSKLSLRDKLYLKWKYSHIANWYYSMKNRRQRAKMGYSYYDVSDMDNWFLNIIPKMLRDLKNKKHSYPELFNDEWYEKNKERCYELDIDVENFYWDLEQRTDEEGKDLFDDLSEYNYNKWNEILDKMIFLFEESNEETCKKKNPYKEEYFKQFSIDLPDSFFSKKELRERKKNPPQRDEEAYEKLCKTGRI